MFFESKGYQPIEPIHKSPEVNKLPPIFECYVNEAIKKGLGLPPSKEVFMTTSDYGAKCMLIGYEKGRKQTKKKYKKKIKELKAKLKKADKKSIGKLIDTLEKNDITGLSFAFEPEEEQ